MAKIDKVDCFSCDNIHHELLLLELDSRLGMPKDAHREENPPQKDMCVVSILPFLSNVRKRNSIELGLSSSTCRIHRKQYRKRKTSPHKAYKCQHLEEPQVKVTVKRLMIENILVWNISKTLQPAKLPLG